MAKRIPGPHDDQLLPIKQANDQVRNTLYEVQEYLRWLSTVVPRYGLIGYSPVFKKESRKLEKKLRQAADALAQCRETNKKMSQKVYIQLSEENEVFRRNKMSKKRAREEHQS